MIETILNIWLLNNIASLFFLYSLDILHEEEDYSFNVNSITDYLALFIAALLLQIGGIVVLFFFCIIYLDEEGFELIFDNPHTLPPIVWYLPKGQDKEIDKLIGLVNLHNFYLLPDWLEDFFTDNSPASCNNLLLAIQAYYYKPEYKAFDWGDYK